MATKQFKYHMSEQTRSQENTGGGSVPKQKPVAEKRIMSTTYSHSLRLTLTLPRASAAALSTVLSTTMLSYDFRVYFQTEIPQPINMKLCVIDYVG
jgi:hypothetical protein